MRKFLVLILLFAITFGLVVNTKSITSNIYYKFVSDNDGLYGSDVSCIEVDANNPNIIYVGTRSEGIFVSTDSGHNWKWIGKGFEVNLPDYRKTYYEIFSIKTIKGKPGLIYVATYGGLFVSTDGGMNFILNRSLNRKTFSLYISPDNPNYLIVGTENGIYISNDGGKTFEEKNNNITNISVFSILKDSSMKDAYYIGTDKGIFKTLDNCDTWLLLPNGISGTIYGITQHPNKPYIIYAASSIGIYITYDYGDHWGNLTDKFIPALKSYSVYVDSFNDRLVLAITAKEVILSNDGGNTWSTMIQAFPETQINCGIPVDLQFTKIYLGTRIGFAAYEDKALSFYNNGLGLLDISAVGYDQNYGYLYAESRLGLYTKLSQGNLWNYLSGALYGANAHSFAVDPTVPNSMFAATYYGIMWSTNNGKDWSLTNLTSSEFFSVTFSKANPKYVFAGGYGGLYMSKDSGYNFSRILYNFEVPIYSVVAPSSQSIFVLTKSYIYKSDDLGKTFTIINDKVKNLNPTVLAGDFNDPNVFYLGTTNGLYISKDSCLTFEPFGDLKPNTFIYSIVSLKDGTIYIGTDSGVYRGIIATDNNPPQIVISSPIDNATVTSPVLRIVGNVSDSESGVYKLTVNGLEVQFDTNGNFVYDLSLAPGLNNIEVRAFDKAGNVSTKILSISYKKTVILTLFIGSDKLTTSDGEIIKLDSPPVIVEGRTLVPIRPIIEKLGGTISWTASEQKVTIILGNKTLELWIGKPQARVNGALVWIDPNNTKVVPLIINGRTMLPVRFVSEQLGAKVDWDASLKKITITYPGP